MNTYKVRFHKFVCLREPLDVLSQECLDDNAGSPLEFTVKAPSAQAVKEKLQNFLSKALSD